MVAWSSTFKRSASKAILMFWLLLLAVGHTFYPLTIVHRNYHFQICPKDHVEPLPKVDYQTPFLDDAWSKSFHSLVSASQQASPFFENGSVPACIYSCFANTAYIGRSSQDIIVFGYIRPSPFNVSKQRITVILFWWAYAFLALVTLFTTEKKGCLPKWLNNRVCSVEHRQQLLMSILNCMNNGRLATTIFRKGQDGGADSTTFRSVAVARYPPPTRFHITTLQLIQSFTQISSVAAFGGNILYNELLGDGVRRAYLEQESFAAVGQWGCVAVVVLVLFAAVVGRIWAADESGGRPCSIAAEGIQSLDDWDESSEEEWMGMKEWDSRVGYAS